MLDCYKNAWLVEPPRVLGVQLLPLSIGHAYLLEAYDSPLVEGGTARIGDLAFAVWICSRTFRRCLSGLRDSKKTTKTCRRWGRRTRRLDYKDELAVFKAYGRAYFDAPERWESKGGSKQSGVEWTFMLAWAMSGGRIDPRTHADIWDVPVNMALAYNAARLTLGGDDTFVSEDVRKLIDSGGQPEGPGQDSMIDFGDTG